MYVFTIQSDIKETVSWYSTEWNKIAKGFFLATTVANRLCNELKSSLYFCPPKISFCDMQIAADDIYMARIMEDTQLTKLNVEVHMYLQNYPKYSQD